MSVVHLSQYARERAERNFSSYQDTEATNFNLWDAVNWLQVTEDRQIWLYGAPRQDPEDIAAWDRLCNLGRAI